MREIVMLKRAENEWTLEGERRLSRQDAELQVVVPVAGAVGDRRMDGGFMRQGGDEGMTIKALYRIVQTRRAMLQVF